MLDVRGELPFELRPPVEAAAGVPRTVRTAAARSGPRPAVRHDADDRRCDSRPSRSCSTVHRGNGRVAESIQAVHALRIPYRPDRPGVAPAMRANHRMAH